MKWKNHEELKFLPEGSIYVHFAYSSGDAEDKTGLIHSLTNHDWKPLIEIEDNLFDCEEGQVLVLEKEDIESLIHKLQFALKVATTSRTTKTILDFMNE